MIARNTQHPHKLTLNPADGTAFPNMRRYFAATDSPLDRKPAISKSQPASTIMLKHTENSLLPV